MTVTVRIESGLLAIHLLMVGLYAGIHWFNLLGGLPALRELERAETFVDFWQHVDRYMRRRMRVFGPALMASGAVPLIWFAWRGQWGVAGGVLLTLALLLADVGTAIRGNLPLNDLIQSWPLHAIPRAWPDVRRDVLRYFHIRGALSLAAYGMLLYTVVAMWAPAAARG